MADGRMDYIIGIDDSELRNGAAQVNRQFDNIGQHAEQVGNDIDSAFRKAGAAIGAYFAVDKIKEFATEVFNVRAQMQSLQISFETLLGSQEKAAALFNEMKSFAVSTPMQLGDLASAAQTMLGFGIATEEVMPMLKALGDISMGNTQKFQSLSLAFSQMSATGKLMGQDLLQMINAGFNPLNEISKQTGKSVATLKEEMSKGSISAKQVADAFKAASAEGGQFAGMLEKQSKGLAGAMSNMEGAWQDALNSIGEEYEDTFASFLELSTDAIKNFDKLGGTILSLVAAFGAYKGVLIAIEAYHSVMNSQQAAAEATRQAQLATLAAETQATLTGVAATDADTASKQANVTAIDQRIAAIQAEIQAQLEQAAIEEQQAQMAVVRADIARNSADELVDAKNAAYEAALKSGDGEAIERAELALGEASAEARAAAEAQNTAQKNLAAAASNKAAIAEKAQTLQTQVDTVNKKANTTATSLWAATTRMATTAMNGLKAAIMSNPIGLALGAITAVIGVLMTFRKEADETAKMTEKFGEAADKATIRVKNLMAIIAASTTNSKVHEKAVDELKDIYVEYGVIADKEKVTLQELIDKRNELTAAIRNESAERERANQLQAASESHDSKMNEIWGDFEGEFSDKTRQGIRTVMQTVFNEEALGEISKFYEEWDKLEYENSVGRSVTWTAEQRKRHQELAAIMEGYAARATAALKELGLTQEEIDKVMQDAYGRQARRNESTIGQLLEEVLHYGNVQKAVNTAADAMTNWDDANVRAAYQAKLSKMSVEELHAEVEALATAVRLNSELGIVIKAHYDDSEVPDYIRNMTNAQRIDRARRVKSALEKNPNAQSFYDRELKKNVSRNHLEDELGANIGYTMQQTTTPPKTTSSPTKTPKTKKDDPNEAARKQEQYNEKVKKAAREAERAAKDAEFERRQNEIDIMAEDTERTIAQLKLDFEKQKEEIRRGYEDLVQEKIDGARSLFESNPNNKGKLFSQSEEAKTAGQLTDEEKKLYGTPLYDSNGKLTGLQGGTKLAAAQNTYTKGVTEAYAAEAQAMREFLKEYGTYQQQKLAIAEEYADKISKATTEGERKKLEKDRDKAIDAVDMEAVKNSINWAEVFGDFGGLLQEELRNNLDALRSYMRSDEFKNLDASDQQKIVEAVNQLKAHTGGDFSGLELKKIGEFTNAFTEAQRKLAAARDAEKAAIDKVKEAQGELAAAQKTGSQAEIEAAKQKVDSAKQTADQASEAVQSATKEFSAAGNNLHDATSKAVDAFNGLSNAISQIKSGSLQTAFQGIKNLAGSLSTLLTNNLGNFIGKMGNAVGGVLKKVSDAFGSGIGEIIGAALGLLDLLKDGIGSIIADLTDLALNAVNGILDDLMSGNIVTKPLQSLTSGLRGIANTLTFGLFDNWFGLGSNAKQVQETTDRLTKSNEVLADRIDSLKEAIGNSAGGKALFSYQKAVEAQEQINKQQMEILRTQMGEWGKHHSNNYYTDDRKIAGYNASAQAAFRAAGVNAATITGLASIYNLTPEQLKAIRDFAPDLWKYLTEVGKYDKSEYWDAVVEQAGKTAELTEQIRQNLTQSTFDSMRDAFASALTDMNSSSQDFAKNFEDIMFKAIVNSFVLDDKFDEWLQGFYDKWADKIKSGNMSRSDWDSFNAEYNGKLAEKTTERDRWAQAMGYTGGGTGQETSKKGFATASQDSIDELNGRFTAVQMSTTKIEEMLSTHIVNVAEIRASQADRGTQLNEMTNLIVIANNNLEAIAKNTKELYGIREDIASIKRNTDKL